MTIEHQFVPDADGGREVDSCIYCGLPNRSHTTTEQVSSKLCAHTVLEAIEWRDADKGGTRYHCCNCLREYASPQEIERLTAELAGTKDELYSVDKAAKELGAERDRLTATVEELRTVSAGLRAALERAKAEIEVANRGTTHWDDCTERHWDCRVAKIINEALAGAADETTAVLSKTVVAEGPCTHQWREDPYANMDDCVVCGAKRIRAI